MEETFSSASSHEWQEVDEGVVKVLAMMDLAAHVSADKGRWFFLSRPLSMSCTLILPHLD